MNLPPFPEGFLPRSPEEKLMLVQWGEQCRAMYKEDAERLDWLMLHVSGRELRRLNMWTSAGCDRAAIDAARKERNVAIPFNIVIDKHLPPDTLEIRDSDGKLKARVTGIDAARIDEGRWE